MNAANSAAAAYRVRPAAPEDAPLLHALVRELADYEHLAHEVASTPAAFAEHLFGERAFARALLAFTTGDAATGDAVGFAVWYPTYSTFAGRPGAFLEDLFVRVEHRRRGVGGLLFDAFAADAAARGCRRLEWRALNWNAPALAFYRRRGAAVLDDWLTLRMEV
ncbi:MAG: GNAT family N-acetyltransferase [Puniceicoccales bacterium]|jgi:GNAT superfamily N-acetyltransferase|nr:GNAT family N-acetyltransferase [Puniceicoccales bacterium]